MQFSLTPHPSALPADPAFKLWVNFDHAGSFGAVATTNLWFCVGAPTGRFVIPQAAEPARVDGLWQTTCFEVFLRPAGDEGYREWNFAPSGQWAAYDFAAYREAMAVAKVAAPYVRIEDNLTWWALGATIAVEAGAWKLGISAVLEEQDGTKSYWALAHPSEKPDFHDPGCFIARLP